MKKAIVTGVTGQVGSYMVDYLLENQPDIEIYGGIRRLSVANHDNIRHVDNPRFKLIDLDVADHYSVGNAVCQVKPDYIMNFAANSFVGNSWEMPVSHFNTNALGVLYFLEYIRRHSPETRFYQANSSEMFGDVVYSPQDEYHPMRPRSPYGVSKCAAQNLIKVYRDSYDLYAVSGICFNHESPRRGKEFVTRKITYNAALIAQSLMRNLPWEPIQLGNMGAQRDWSHAKDVVDAVWRMLNQDVYNKDFKEVRDYIVASGETNTIAYFLDKAFEALGIDGIMRFDSDHVDWDKASYHVRWQEQNVLAEVNKEFFRPADVELLLGDPSKIKQELGWEAQYKIDDLIAEMALYDMKLAAKELSE